MGLTELSPFENSKENFKYEKQWEQGKYDNIVKVAKEINKKIEIKGPRDFLRSPGS